MPVYEEELGTAW